MIDWELYEAELDAERRAPSMTADEFDADCRTQLRRDEVLYNDGFCNDCVRKRVEGRHRTPEPSGASAALYAKEEPHGEG